MTLLTNSTPVALWQSIIHDAQASCETPLTEELEAYLVFLLVRYTDKPEVAKQVMASEFLRSVMLDSRNRQVALQEVGDKCLLYTGLFPLVAQKRLVKIGYFVNLGQLSYETVSKKRNDIYNLLAHKFVALMDVLQSIRVYTSKYPDLLPLEAYELWNETGSQRALSVLKQYTKSSPVITIEKGPCLFK